MVPGFDTPVRVTVDWPILATIRPTTSWQRVRVKLPNASEFRVYQIFYVVVTGSSEGRARE